MGILKAIVICVVLFVGVMVWALSMETDLNKVQDEVREMANYGVIVASFDGEVTDEAIVKGIIQYSLSFIPIDRAAYAVPVDVWGGKYRVGVRREGAVVTVEVVSDGPDGDRDTSDDIRSRASYVPKQSYKKPNPFVSLTRTPSNAGRRLA